MSNKNYRPEIDESIFVSLNNEQPFLTTVKKYFYDKRFTGEQFEYIRKNGHTNSTSLKNATFYPDAPIDTPFIYIVVLEQHEFMERSETFELGFFFNPQSAFDFIDSILSGEIKINHISSSEFENYSVQVEKA